MPALESDSKRSVALDAGITNSRSCISVCIDRSMYKLVHLVICSLSLADQSEIIYRCELSLSIL